MARTKVRGGRSAGAAAVSARATASAALGTTDTALGTTDAATAATAARAAASARATAAVAVSAPSAPTFISDLSSDEEGDEETKGLHTRSPAVRKPAAYKRRKTTVHESSTSTKMLKLTDLVTDPDVHEALYTKPCFAAYLKRVCKVKYI